MSKLTPLEALECVKKDSFLMSSDTKRWLSVVEEALKDYELLVELHKKTEETWKLVVLDFEKQLQVLRLIKKHAIIQDNILTVDFNRTMKMKNNTYELDLETVKEFDLIKEEFKQ